MIPSLNKRKAISCYAAWTKDRQLLMASSSGGVFTELSRVVLSFGGVVFGAAWADDFSHVVHVGVDSEQGLRRLRGSKYSVSDLSGVYKPIRRYLSEGRKVLFVGTPCQTAAMRKVFGDDANLFLCALICMANADRQLWEAYIARVEKMAKSQLVNVSHRAKKENCRGSYVVIEFQDPSKNISEPLSQNEYWKSFMDNPRRVCRTCQFRNGRNAADILIGDFWGVERVFPDLGEIQGVGAVLAYTDRGINLLERTGLSLRSVEYAQILLGNPYLERQFKPLRPREYGILMRCRRCVGRMLRTVGLRK